VNNRISNKERANNFEIKKKDEFIVIEIKTQRFDLKISKSLQELVCELIEEKRHKLILDFNTVNFLDSSGLGVLVFLTNSYKQDNGFAIFNINSFVIKDLLNLTRMDEFLNIHNTYDECVNSILNLEA